LNARKLMARLNASTVRFDVGRGGLPELTPQDVAGALGFVKDEFAREVFCAIWWPDGAAISRQSLNDRLRAMLLEEFARRCRQSEVARLEYHLAQANFEARRVHSRSDRAELARLAEQKTEADRERWPGEMAIYPQIAYGVLAELVSSNQCGRCGGRGVGLDGMVVVTCPKCDGRGSASSNDVRRATLIGKEPSAYRKTWARVYEWLYDKAASAESTAAKLISRQLDPSSAADVTPPLLPCTLGKVA